MASSEITLQAVSSASQIPAEEWDACANPLSSPASLNGLDREQIATALAGGLVALGEATKASSVHVTFAREAEAKFLAAREFLLRNDQQFHWHNAGYGSFEDFLASLNSRHRKSIRRE